MAQDRSEAKLPYTDKDVARVLGQLIRDPALLKVLGGWILPRLVHWLPGFVSWLIRRNLSKRFNGISTIAEFLAIVRDYVEQLVDETITGFEVIGLEALDPDQGYLFLSNHRDIAGDSMLLNLALHRAGLPTVYIAVGDNLIEQTFATDLMRLNKSFFINRTSENPRQVYRDLTGSSSFIRDSIAAGDSVWLAQSEGRAKNAIDKTDESVLKMLQLSDRKMPLSEKVAQLNIVPLCLSYEFDPLDVSKAIELGEIAKAGHYQKQPGEDLVNLAKGLSGEKGRVQLTFGQRLNDDFASTDTLAAAIDKQILAGTQLYPINYWAAKRVDPSFEHPALAEISTQQADGYQRRFMACPDSYRSFWLEIYANPVARVMSQRV